MKKALLSPSSGARRGRGRSAASLVVVVVIATSLGGGGSDSGSSGGGSQAGQAQRRQPQRPHSEGLRGPERRHADLDRPPDRRSGRPHPRAQPRRRPADPDLGRNAEAAVRVAPARLAALAAIPLLTRRRPRCGAGAPSGRPQLDARAWALIDARTGEVLVSHAATRHLPIASTTKLMTAWVVLHELPLDRIVRAAPYDADLRRVAAQPAPGPADQRSRPALRADPAQRQRRRLRPRPRRRRLGGRASSAR